MNRHIFTDDVAVQRLQANVDRFYSLLINCLPGPIARADRIAAALADKQNLLELRVSTLNSMTDNDESRSTDDDEATLTQLSAANEELSKIRAQVKQLAQARANYQRESQRCDQLAREHTSMAKKFLHRVLDDLRAYRATEFQSQDTPVLYAIHSNTALTPLQCSPSFYQHESDPFPDYKKFPLPRNFSWLSLSLVEATSDVSESNKISFQDMRTGFQLLRTFILPTFSDFGPSVGRDWFYAQDMAKQGSTDYSILKVYEAFFGSDSIAIDRNTDHSCYRITNGRHRIFIARQLGWEAVPVIFTDQHQA